MWVVSNEFRLLRSILRGLDLWGCLGREGCKCKTCPVAVRHFAAASRLEFEILGFLSNVHTWSVGPVPSLYSVYLWLLFCGKWFCGLPGGFERLVIPFSVAMRWCTLNYCRTSCCCVCTEIHVHWLSNKSLLCKILLPSNCCFWIGLIGDYDRDTRILQLYSENDILYWGNTFNIPLTWHYHKQQQRFHQFTGPIWHQTKAYPKGNN